MQDFVWCTVLHYTHIQNCNNSKAWNSLLLETFMEGCRCSLLLLSQRIHLDQWPGPAGFCWMEATARACPATICAESWQCCRSNQKTREINHWQRFAVCGFHNIFSPSSTPITTNFFFYRAEQRWEKCFAAVWAFSFVLLPFESISLFSAWPWYPPSSMLNSAVKSWTSSDHPPGTGTRDICTGKLEAESSRKEELDKQTQMHSI